jgi:glycosyltransferase involved in cell wall biosynthesis
MQRFSVNAMVDETQRLYDEVSRVETQPRGAVPVVDGTRRTVGLVASQFPRHVDAYFLREISALAARGVRFRIFSLRTFKSDIVHAAARPFVADTVYVPFVLSWPLLRANGRFLRRNPGRYLRALAEVVSGCLSRPRSLLLSVAVFPKSVYFAELAEQEGLAHIHANWASHPAASALVMSMLTGIPWSFAGHASDIYVDGSMLRDKIRAKFVVTCTHHNRTISSGSGAATRDKVTVSYHGVDLDRFKPDPNARGDRFTILTAGTLRECKGLPDLIEACRILADRGVSFFCSIVGDGEERRPLERLIRKKGLEDRIRITGYLAQEHIIPLYQQADVVVLPALSESHFGIPNILLEAFAVETPVICTPLASLDEVMKDGVHGLYIRERDPGALADALATLAGDPARCRAMGAAGRRQIEALFDSDKNVTTLLALFRGVVESSSLRTPLSLEAISPTRPRLREES